MTFIQPVSTQSSSNIPPLAKGRLSSIPKSDPTAPTIPVQRQLERLSDTDQKLAYDRCFAPLPKQAQDTLLLTPKNNKFLNRILLEIMKSSDVFIFTHKNLTAQHVSDLPATKQDSFFNGLIYAALRLSDFSDNQHTTRYTPHEATGEFVAHNCVANSLSIEALNRVITRLSPKKGLLYTTPPAYESFTSPLAKTLIETAVTQLRAIKQTKQLEADLKAKALDNELDTEFPEKKQTALHYFVKALYFLDAAGNLDGLASSKDKLNAMWTNAGFSLPSLPKLTPFPEFPSFFSSPIPQADTVTPTSHTDTVCEQAAAVAAGAVAVAAGAVVSYRSNAPRTLGGLRSLVTASATIISGVLPIVSSTSAQPSPPTSVTELYLPKEWADDIDDLEAPVKNLLKQLNTKIPSIFLTNHKTFETFEGLSRNQQMKFLNVILTFISEHDPNDTKKWAAFFTTPLILLDQPERIKSQDVFYTLFIFLTLMQSHSHFRKIGYLVAYKHNSLLADSFQKVPRQHTLRNLYRTLALMYRICSTDTEKESELDSVIDAQAISHITDFFVQNAASEWKEISLTAMEHLLKHLSSSDTLITHLATKYKALTTTLRKIKFPASLSSLSNALLKKIDAETPVKPKKKTTSNSTSKIKDRKFPKKWAADIQKYPLLARIFEKTTDLASSILTTLNEAEKTKFAQDLFKFITHHTPQDTKGWLSILTQLLPAETSNNDLDFFIVFSELLTSSDTLQIKRMGYSVAYEFYSKFSSALETTESGERILNQFSAYATIYSICRCNTTQELNQHFNKFKDKAFKNLSETTLNHVYESALKNLFTHLQTIDEYVALLATEHPKLVISLKKINYDTCTDKLKNSKDVFFAKIDQKIQDAAFESLIGFKAKDTLPTALTNYLTLFKTPHQLPPFPTNYSTELTAGILELMKHPSYSNLNSSLSLFNDRFVDIYEDKTTTTYPKTLLKIANRAKLIKYRYLNQFYFQMAQSITQKQTDASKPFKDPFHFFNILDADIKDSFEFKKHLNPSNTDLFEVIKTILSSEQGNGFKSILIKILSLALDKQKRRPEDIQNSIRYFTKLIDYLAPTPNITSLISEIKAALGTSPSFTAVNFDISTPEHAKKTFLSYLKFIPKNQDSPKKLTHLKRNLSATLTAIGTIKDIKHFLKRQASTKLSDAEKEVCQQLLEEIIKKEATENKSKTDEQESAFNTGNIAATLLTLVAAVLSYFLNQKRKENDTLKETLAQEQDTAAQANETHEAAAKEQADALTKRNLDYAKLKQEKKALTQVHLATLEKTNKTIQELTEKLAQSKDLVDSDRRHLIQSLREITQTRQAARKGLFQVAEHEAAALGIRDNIAAHGDDHSSICLGVYVPNKQIPDPLPKEYKSKDAYIHHMIQIEMLKPNKERKEWIQGGLSDYNTLIEYVKRYNKNPIIRDATIGENTHYLYKCSYNNTVAKFLLDDKQDTHLLTALSEILNESKHTQMTPAKRREHLMACILGLPAFSSHWIEELLELVAIPDTLPSTPSPPSKKGKQKKQKACAATHPAAATEAPFQTENSQDSFINFLEKTLKTPALHHQFAPLALRLMKKYPKNTQIALLLVKYCHHRLLNDTLHEDTNNGRLREYIETTMNDIKLNDPSYDTLICAIAPLITYRNTDYFTGINTVIDAWSRIIEKNWTDLGSDSQHIIRKYLPHLSRDFQETIGAMTASTTQANEFHPAIRHIKTHFTGMVADIINGSESMLEATPDGEHYLKAVLTNAQDFQKYLENQTHPLIFINLITSISQLLENLLSFYVSQEAGKTMPIPSSHGGGDALDFIQTNAPDFYKKIEKYQKLIRLWSQRRMAAYRYEYPVPSQEFKTFKALLNDVEEKVKSEKPISETHELITIMNAQLLCIKEIFGKMKE